MNIMDKLLQIDAKKLTERETKVYEVKRLTKMLGGKFDLTLQAIDAELYSEIQKNAMTIKKGNINDIDLFKMQVRTIVEGVREPNLKDTKLMAHFGAATPVDLVSKLFLSGEIADVSAEISTLCGYVSQAEVDEKIKN